MKKAFLVILGFGSLHLAISTLDHTAYNVLLTPLDSIYFSVVTFTTVGYGDILPKAGLAKTVCMTEIISGVMILILAINIAAAVWLQEHHPSQLKAWKIA